MPPEVEPVAENAKPKAAAAGPRWADLLAINSSTGALLGAIVLVCMGSELWGPFLPKYMQDLAAPIFLIALYGSFRDLLEAINYLLGGWIAGRFNTRRGLLLFNALPLVGLVVLMLWHHPAAVFIAIPFVFVWDSLAGPALLTVVGDSLPPDRRAMAFSLQSFFRRMARILAYAVNAVLVLVVGQKLGMQAAFGVSMGVVVVSLLVQARFMKTASKDASGTIILRPLGVLRGFDPQLKRLLVADIGARLAEGMPRELIILFTVAVLAMAGGADSFLHRLAGQLGMDAREPGVEGLGGRIDWAIFGLLLILSQVTSAITYIPMGFVASRPGLAKKPYIGLTFFFFAAFPAVLAGVGGLALAGVLPAWSVVWLLALSFVFAGMREIGEPARKAMIVDLIPPAQKTQAIGIYWSSRCVAVMIAPLVGGAIWVGVNLLTGSAAADPTGWGPLAMLAASSFCGILGVIYYYTRFGK
jgi:MFS family permease